jgi:uncharacterized protein (TIGR03435 family)
MLKTFSGAFALFIALAAATASAQPAASSSQGPSFEVATIKPSPAITTLTPQALMSGQIRIGLNVTGSRVDIGLSSLADLVRIAYDVKPFQVTGPDWLTTERFDITAKLPEGATRKDVNAMLQTLLAERFGLVVHREQKDRPVFALVVGKDGPKMKPGVSEEAPKADAPPPLFSSNGSSVSQLTQNRDSVNMTVSGGATGQVKISMTPAGEHIEALDITMAALADTLTPMSERPVIDQTGLSGTYQVTIDIPLQELMAIAQRAAASIGMALPQGATGAPGGAAAGGAPVASDPGGGSSINDSLQKNGLQLDRRTAPVEVVVVDHIEKTPKEE